MENRMNMFMSYVNANVAPILVDFIKSSDVKDAVIISSTISKEELNGHYEGVHFVPPTWLKPIIDGEKRILIIDRIDKLEQIEQSKFCELLKYRKISTFELPKNCIILLTANEINKQTIHAEIFSLVAHI